MANDELKDAIKEAAKEWLDDQFTKVGKWTLGSFFAVLLAGALVFAVKYGS